MITATFIKNSNYYVEFFEGDIQITYVYDKYFMLVAYDYGSKYNRQSCERSINRQFMQGYPDDSITPKLDNIAYNLAKSLK